jgi:hypothetical protein
MLTKYQGILSGDRIVWEGERPDPEFPFRVEVVILGAPPMTDAERGRRMAAILERIAQSGPSGFPEDPVAWQREIRKDRPLPGREDD